MQRLVFDPLILSFSLREKGLTYKVCDIFDYRVNNPHKHF
jgi:hypothetical protein